MTMLSRQELEAMCDELMEKRNQAESEWTQAKINHENLKNHNKPLLRKIMDELEKKHGDETSENKLERMAMRDETWVKHNKAQKEAYALMKQKELLFNRYRKEYQLIYMKFMKS